MHTVVRLAPAPTLCCSGHALLPIGLLKVFIKNNLLKKGHLYGPPAPGEPLPEAARNIAFGMLIRTNRPNGLGCHAPLLGQHTDAVLETLLGLNAEQRQYLRAEGVIE